MRQFYESTAISILLVWFNSNIMDLTCHLGNLRWTYLSLVPHISDSELGSISSDNGLSPIQRQAII